jgi:acetyltransferase-like isoleucine patch superfamily enzyme
MTIDLGAVEGALDLHADHDVLLGYPSDRAPDAGPLRLGRRARLRSGTVLYLGTTVGDDLSTGHHVVVREECRVGHRVSIWSDSYVDYGVVIGNDVKIHVGCYIGQFSELGDGVFLAPGVVFTNDLYPGNDVSAGLMTGPRIGAGAQIGAGVTLLPFVEVGAGSLIGAGSVVTHDIPPGMVAFGSPARVAGPVADLTDPDRRMRELFEARRRVEATDGDGHQP